MTEWLRRATRLLEQGQEAVLVSIVQATGSTPGKVGAKMLVSADSAWGTVGGGALEKMLAEEARVLLASDDGPRLKTIQADDIGMACGGEVTAFIEPLRCGPSLWIFGGGHIAAALVPMVDALGFRVTVVDNRAAFAAGERFGGKASTLLGSYGELAPKTPRGAFAVIVTHGHDHDEEVLGALAQIEPKLPYIGMIGSRRKVRRVFDALSAKGIELGGNVYAPVGLELGGDSPSQIAVSIASEVLAVSQGKAGLAHCRDRLGKAL